MTWRHCSAAVKRRVRWAAEATRSGVGKCGPALPEYAEDALRPIPRGQRLEDLSANQAHGDSDSALPLDQSAAGVVA